MIVRDATLHADDLKGIMLVWQAAFAEKVKLATVVNKIEVQAHILIVAEENGVIVGFLNAMIFPKHWRVDYVAAHPIDAPKGTGTKLMETIEAWAKDAGITTITLAVRRKNARAIKLYERLGYVMTEERPAGFSYRKTLEL